MSLVADQPTPGPEPAARSGAGFSLRKDLSPVLLGKRLRRLLQDPPPAWVFELSHAGIAYCYQGKEPQTGFRPLESGVLAISPLKDNVVRPEELFEQVRSLAPANGKGRRRTAALILPDYCARVAVLDFDNLPSKREEQASLVRFRMKKSIPFELDSARVSFDLQPGAGAKKHMVVAAVAALEIIARYEAAFRNAGFQPGYVTTSTLAALSLLPEDGVRILAKLSGGVLTAAVTEGQSLRLLRCVSLAEVTPQEVMAVLYPTFAYVEDEFGARPSGLVLCGFGSMTEEIQRFGQSDLGMAVDLLRSRLGEPGEANAGLLGFLESTGLETR